MKVFKLNLFKSKNKKLLVFCLLVINSILNAQSVTGTRGLVHIPTAELFEDKTFVLGASYIPKGYFIRFNQSVNPGMPTYATLTLFPFMEVMFRYTNELAKGDLIAIFDADFTPKSDWLLKTWRFIKPKVKLPIWKTSFTTNG